MAHTFRRARDGSLRVALSHDECELLTTVTRDLALVVSDPPNPQINDRLYPRAYLDPTEEDAEQEFQRLVHDDLRSSRVATFLAVGHALASAMAGSDGGPVELHLDAAAEAQWMTALNDARLVIGTTLGITEDDQVLEPNEHNVELILVYEWLLMLHSELIELLLDEIGTDGADY